jgi:hypothetical protein
MNGPDCVTYTHLCVQLSETRTNPTNVPANNARYHLCAWIYSRIHSHNHSLYPCIHARLTPLSHTHSFAAEREDPHEDSCHVALAAHAALEALQTRRVSTHPRG